MTKVADPLLHQAVDTMSCQDSQQTTQAMPQQTNPVMPAYPPLLNMFSMPPPPLPFTNQNEKVQDMLKKEIADFRKIFTDFAKQLTSTPSSRNKFRSPPRPSTPEKRALICYKCHKEGHVIRDCPDNKQSPTSTSSSLNSPRSK